MNKIKENLGPFFVLWGIIIFLNQFLLFHACFNPACIVAALPHTGVITLVLLPFLLKNGKVQKQEHSYEAQHPETKQKALKKLNAVIMKVGYPDKWKDMSKLQVDKNSYVRNVMNANAWVYDYMISQYGKPVDRTKWSMYPQTYNAYYNPSNNEIVIPGCNIIVPGYEGRMADDAILYAVIGGSTFGHELTHGFDDQGCKFDEKGNLQNWWTAEDSKRFGAKTKMIVKQFNDFVTVDNLHINGELTQGENIADLGGVMMGLEAFKKTEQYKKNEKIAGLTPTQRYFLGYALAWMVNMRPEGISTQVKTDEHSPAQWRVLGPLANLPEFYEAFGVKKGDKMWRADNERVQIW
jgi:putative endopeptidase